MRRMFSDKQGIYFLGDFCTSIIITRLLSQVPHWPLEYTHAHKDGHLGVVDQSAAHSTGVWNLDYDSAAGYSRWTLEVLYTCNMMQHLWVLVAGWCNCFQGYKLQFIKIGNDKGERSRVTVTVLWSLHVQLEVQCRLPFIHTCRHNPTFLIINTVWLNAHAHMHA